MSNIANPTPEQLRQARHLGVKASLSHLPEAKRQELLGHHEKLDARREKNVSAFLHSARGGKTA